MPTAPVVSVKPKPASIVVSFIIAVWVFFLYLLFYFKCCCFFFILYFYMRFIFFCPTFEIERPHQSFPRHTHPTGALAWMQRWCKCRTVTSHIYFVCSNHCILKQHQCSCAKNSFPFLIVTSLQIFGGGKNTLHDSTVSPELLYIPPLCILFYNCTVLYHQLTVSYVVLYDGHRLQIHSAPYKPVQRKDWIALSLALEQVPVCCVQCFHFPVSLQQQKESWNFFIHIKIGRH